MSQYMTIPIELMELAMSQLSPNGFKLMMFVWRKTAGWQKERDYISYQQMMDATGIGSKVTLKKAIKEVGKIFIVTPGHGRSNLYEFDVSDHYHAFEKGTESEPLPEQKVQEVNQLEDETPVKGSVSILKGTESEPTITTHTITKKDSLPLGKARPKRKPKKPKEPIPEPIKVYHSEAHRYPPETIWPDITNEVDSTPDELERWRVVVHEYIKCGWNKLNIAGMLNFYTEHRIPTTQPVHKNGAHKNETHQKSNQRRGTDLQQEPTFNPYTGQTVPADVP